MHFVNPYNNTTNQLKQNTKKPWKSSKTSQEIQKRTKIIESYLFIIYRDSSDSDYSGD
jgi:hypothetical protein